MKKLKDLLKESFVWERHFGEKLPTLDSVQNKYEKKQLNEKKELDSKTIQAVAKMTDSNAHTHARMELAQALRDKKLEKAYRALNELHNYFRQMNELMHAREKLDKELKAKLQSKFANFDEIWGAL